MNTKIKQLLNQMILKEKIAMLAGSDFWRTMPIERLGIPAIKVSDGPNGVRGSQSTGKKTSACFPCGTALASTWNIELIEKVGVALAEELKRKNATILLAPTVNIHRSPLAGRNFECFSEDPYLTGRMAVAYINGVQSQGVGTCIKHFVCNDSEFERSSISSELHDRALREIYLLPFQIAIKESRPWMVMSAYNKVNGTYCSEHPYLLNDILKNEWGFDGVVISDWFGTYSHEVAKWGLDLEMPGTARWMNDKIMEMVESGQVSQAVIDDKVRRLLCVIEKANSFEHVDLSAESEKAIDNPAHRQVIREAACEGIIMLKNDSDVLPLNPEKLNHIAVIGMNAKYPQIHGGGSAAVSAHYIVSPLEGITNRVGDAAQVSYAFGCPIHKLLPLVNMKLTKSTHAKDNGLTIEFFNNQDLEGDPVYTDIILTSAMMWLDNLPSNVNPDAFSARITGIFVPEETGKHTFSLVSAGVKRLFIDDILLIDKWEKYIPTEHLINFEEDEYLADIEMIAGQQYQLRVEYSSRDTTQWRLIRIGCLPPISATAIEDACELAKQSDVAIVVVGLTSEWEREGLDRIDMELPGEQVKLIESIASANKNTIVIVNAGSPIHMAWLDKVPAVMQAWYLGQEAGNAIADIIFGNVNPSGKLPTTFPKRIQDNPAYINYPGENGKVYYGEGIFVGYRYYDKKDIEPLFPFGHGLSYTTFTYHDITIDKTEYNLHDDIQISIEIENTGHCFGKEVVQLYIRDVESSMIRPEKELKGFVKVALESGEKKTITFNLNHKSLSFYDPSKKEWVAEAGMYEILVGSSSHDIRLKEGFELIS